MTGDTVTMIVACLGLALGGYHFFAYGFGHDLMEKRRRQRRIRTHTAMHEDMLRREERHDHRTG